MRRSGFGVLQQAAFVELRFQGIQSMNRASFAHPFFYGKSHSFFSGITGFRASPVLPGRAVVLRIEPPTASRPSGIHR
jgi:hypothetical protein